MKTTGQLSGLPWESGCAARDEGPARAAPEEEGGIVFAVRSDQRRGAVGGRAAGTHKALCVRGVLFSFLLRAWSPRRRGARGAGRADPCSRPQYGPLLYQSFQVPLQRRAAFSSFSPTVSGPPPSQRPRPRLPPPRARVGGGGQEKRAGKSRSIPHPAGWLLWSAQGTAGSTALCRPPVLPWGAEARAWTRRGACADLLQPQLLPPPPFPPWAPVPGAPQTALCCRELRSLVGFQGSQHVPYLLRC